MESALGIGLSNAIVAAVIALLMGISALVWRKPALTHALGVLVLVKLITPPIWGVAVDRWIARGHGRDMSTSPSTSNARVEPGTWIARVPETSGHESNDENEILQSSERAEIDDAPLYVVVPQTDLKPLAKPQAVGDESSLAWIGIWARDSWMTILGAIWICGSGICAGIIIVRIVCFVRLLRFAAPACPELQSRTAGLARRMGMAQGPMVCFVPGAVCPMLWAIGRTQRLLVPSELWDRLGERQRSSLLAHELAHLRRRDHWVRVIELAASVLYWWCPVMWFARRQLREAEEQCCDAWVVWALPGSSRDYAAALLETVEFVTAGGVLSARSMPALASGMGQFHQLKRRLIMIKHEGISKSLSRGGWVVVGALGLMLLPLSPTRAQVSAAPAAEKPETESVDDVLPPPLPPVAPVPSVSATPAVAPGAPATVGVTKGEPSRKWVIEDIKTPTESIRVEKSVQIDGPVPLDVDDPRDPKVRDMIQQTRAEIKELSKQLERAQRQLAELEASQWKNGWKKEGKPNYEASKPGAVPPAPGSAPKNKAVEKTPYPPEFNAKGDVYPKLKKPEDPNAYSGYRTAVDAKRREQRLAEVEANLQKLLDEVRALRNETQPGKPGGGDSSGYSKERPR